MDHRADRLDAFDGLRACAALSVVAYHASLYTAATRSGPLAPILSELKGGVAIFFVITGFLLYLPYARALRDGHELPDWHAFAQRRAARILPGYWVALTILAAGPYAASVLSSNWWRYYGLSQIYSHSTLSGGLPVAWSLCVEVTFYALLPMLAFAVAWVIRRSKFDATNVQAAVVACLAIGCLLLRVALARSMTGTIVSAPLLATSLPGLFDWFAVGMGLALLRSHWEVSATGALARLASSPARCWLLAALLFLVGVPFQHGDTFSPVYSLPTHLALALGSGLLVLPAIAVSPPAPGAASWPLDLLRSPLMAWLGTISYGIYLWHDAVLAAILGRTTVPSQPTSLLVTLGAFAATVAGAIVLGAASWYLVERPAQRRWRPRRPAPVVVAA
jgi:peptidoglycan/LPS O-acetylase OafA/YrhL